MATIYLDTETKNYCEFNWERAVPYQVKESEHPLLTRVNGSAWGLVFLCIGQEAINMRKVCTFFLNPSFNELYRASPLYLDSNFDVSAFMKILEQPERPIKTNISVYKAPSLSSGCLAATVFRLAHYHKIMARMPNLQSLSPLGLFEEYSDPPFVRKVFSNVHSLLTNSIPKWQALLNPVIFPVLQKLECRAFDASSDTSLVKGVLMPFLRSLLISWEGVHTIFGPFALKAVDLEHILATVPNLEELTLYGTIQEDERSLNLDPLSLRHLKKLVLGRSQQSTHLSQLLLAAPFIQTLSLKGAQNMSGHFSGLLEEELPNLQEISFTRADLTKNDLKGLLNAAPKLRHVDLVMSLLSGVFLPAELDRFYPSIKQVNLETSRNGVDISGEIKFVAHFVPFLERMSCLESLVLSGCQIARERVGEASAYKELKNLTVRDASSMKGVYLTDMLNAAKNLESLVWHSSNCDWIFKTLEEGALSQLRHARICRVMSSEEELLSFLTRAIRLQILDLDRFSMEPTEGLDFKLEPHSLPELREFKYSVSLLSQKGALTAAECLQILKAGSQLEKLNIPPVLWDDMHDLPDGYLSHLTIVLNLADFSESQKAELLRVAPTVVLEG